MKILKNNLEFQKEYILYISFFILAFLIEVIYFYPSPGVDSTWFLSLTLNICREDLFIGLKSIDYTRDAIHEEWVRHGWLTQYLMAKLNFNCGIGGFYLLNFIIKVTTSLAIYKILNEKENNKFFLAIIILTIFLIQTKLEFRPETFSILLYCLIFIFFKSKNFFMVGSLLAFLFFTHFIVFCFVGLFGILFFYKNIFSLKKIFNLFLGFVIFIILLDIIYPYSIIDYVEGLFSNRGARVGSGVSLIHENFYNWFRDFLEFFLFPSFIPFWGTIFILLLLSLIFNNYLIFLSLPFIWFFGPHVPMGSYYLQGLTPLILLLQYENQKKTNLFFNYKKISISLLTFFFLLSSSLIFSRSLLTIFHYGDELNNSKKFLSKNLDKIDLLPSFGFLIIDDWKLKDTNTKSLYDTFSANGSRNPCPDKNLKLKNHSLYIFDYKIFNSNSGYGIYICKK
jgi:hypothetical protein